MVDAREIAQRVAAEHLDIRKLGGPVEHWLVSEQLERALIAAAEAGIEAGRAEAVASQEGR